MISSLPHTGHRAAEARGGGVAAEACCWAKALLLHLRRGQPDRSARGGEALRKGRTTIRHAPRDVTAFSRWSKQNSREVGSVLRILADANIVRVERRTGQFELLGKVITRDSLKRAAVARKRELLRLDRMQAYAFHRKCRRKYVMDYFGDTSFRQCAGCDNCSRRGHT